AAIENVGVLFLTFFRAEGLAWRYIITSLAQLIIGLLATISFIICLGYSEEGILYGRLAGDIALLGMLLPYLIKYHPRSNLKLTSDLVRVGLPLVPATLTGMWILMSPRYFIERFGSAADVGVFTMSSKIASIIWLGFIQPFALAWMVALFAIYQR